MLDLDTLNTCQREAVEYIDGPLLVLAGAGSGKTRVLTYRIAHLVLDCHVAPEHILAVTFTNKAAKEMRSRLYGLLGSTAGMWIYTFHSMCVRILRAQAEKIGFSHDFTIYDAADSKRLIKEIMAHKHIDTHLITEKKVANIISQAKNNLVSPAYYKELDTFEQIHDICADVYDEYQTRLARANALDFDDLLYNCYLLFKQFPDVAKFYAENFKYILVDEYQDTNKAQYAITRILASVNKNLMVVGDDDQSIYSWRGADVSNILDFERDWSNCKTIKLEENYRSCGNILEAANAVISHNEMRKSKKLYTSSGAGEKVAIYCASNELDEARWIAGEIERLHDTGTSYNSIACFYRTNAQSRVLEDMFLRAGVPYKIIGGTKFFDRAEIRDVCAYLRCAVNPADDISAQRIINIPRRGIGKTTIEQIMALANTSQISFIEAIRQYVQKDSLRAATKRGLQEFLNIIDCAAKIEGDLLDVIEEIVESTGLINYLRRQNTDEARTRIENIKEFFGVVSDYIESQTEELQEEDGIEEEAEGAAANGALGNDTTSTSDDETVNGAASDSNGTVNEAAGNDAVDEDNPLSLAQFMEWLSLRTDLDTLGENAEETVTFMTVHSAKGLEFDVVFVAGLEENIFPHASSIIELNTEEERRLAYVAITRAKKRLYLTHAQKRKIFNNNQRNSRSRFIDEIPKEITVSKGVGSRDLSGTGWDKRGDRAGIAGSGRGQDMYAGRVFGSIGHTGAASGQSIDYKEKAQPLNFKEGDKVDHKIFGPGIVLSAKGDKLTIKFSKTGKTKTLLASYAPLMKL